MVNSYYRAFSDYKNTPTNSEIFGKLYNWYAVDNNPATSMTSNGSKNVSSTGWHVPTKTEWITLADNVGGGKVAGNKLKEKGTLHWKKPGKEKPTNSTNETGFTALPGGYRDISTIFGSQGYWGITEKLQP